MAYTGYPKNAYRPIVDRFWDRVEIIEGGCWNWIGKLYKGYGRLRDGGGRPEVWAHRWSYLQYAREGSKPLGTLTIDHLCRNTRCVNPDHLEPTTSAVNTMRGESPAAQKARQATCHKGHPFSLTSEGRRCCVTCRQERIRKKAVNWSGAMKGTPTRCYRCGRGLIDVQSSIVRRCEVCQKRPQNCQCEPLPAFALEFGLERGMP